MTQTLRFERSDEMMLEATVDNPFIMLDTPTTTFTKFMYRTTIDNFRESMVITEEGYGYSVVIKGTDKHERFSAVCSDLILAYDQNEDETTYLLRLDDNKLILYFCEEIERVFLVHIPENLWQLILEFNNTMDIPLDPPLLVRQSTTFE